MENPKTKKKPSNTCTKNITFQKCSNYPIETILLVEVKLFIIFFTSSCDLCNLGWFSYSIVRSAKMNISRPCPKSPNITANKKGKVMMV